MDLPKLDVIKTLENSVMTCYKGRSCPSNVTAYVAITNLSSPLGYGWEPKDDIMVPIMTDELPVPLELMKFSVCGCKTSCNTMRCECVKSVDAHRFGQMCLMQKRWYNI